MNNIPVELANARIAREIAWDKYDASIGSELQGELWKVVNWLEERAHCLYVEWQEAGGTSDIYCLSNSDINDWASNAFTRYPQLFGYVRPQLPRLPEGERITDEWLPDTVGEAVALAHGDYDLTISKEADDVAKNFNFQSISEIEI